MKKNPLSISNRRKWSRPHWVVLPLAALLVSACATSPTGRSQFMLISPESAIVQSKTAYLSTVKALDDEDKLLDDPAVVDRVAEITGRVVTAAGH